MSPYAKYHAFGECCRAYVWCNTSDIFATLSGDNRCEHILKGVVDMGDLF